MRGTSLACDACCRSLSKGAKRRVQRVLRSRCAVAVWHGAVASAPKLGSRSPTLGCAQVWARWLRASAGLLRADCLAGRVCGDANRGAALAAVQAACANASASANAAAQLFSVYVHPPPAFRGYPTNSIFRGREVPNRVKVKWGDYSIVEARPSVRVPQLSENIWGVRLLLWRPSQVAWALLSGQNRCAAGAKQL